MRYLILVTAVSACATTQPPRPERQGNKVQCALIANGPASEMCVYPLGVICLAGDKGMSCLQPLTGAGGVQ